jgi:hypothetical protein
VETIAWVSCQPYLLAAFFSLISTLAYLRADVGSHAKTLKGLSWCCFGLGIFSKVACLGLPGVFVCIDIALLKKSGGQSSFAALGRASLKQIPFLGLSLLGGIMAIKANEGQAVDNKLDVLEKILWSSYSLCWYMQKSIVPTDLSLLYPFPAEGFTFGNTTFLATFGIVAAIALVLIAQFFAGRVHSYPSLCWLSFLCLIFPTLGILSSHGHFTLCADRYAYISTMPFVLLLAAGIDYALLLVAGDSSIERGKGKQDRKKGRNGNIPTTLLQQVVLVCVGGVIIYNGICSARLLSTWQTQEGVWKHALSVDPSNSMAYHVSGTLNSEKGDYLTAVSLHKRAFSLKDYRTERGIKWLSLSYQGFLDIGRLMQQQGKAAAGTKFFWIQSHLLLSNLRVYP